MNGRDIELSVCTNANYWVGLPNMNIQDLKELRKSIRKYIKKITNNEKSSNFTWI